MANPGLGFRTVNSLLIEISYHFLQPYVNTIITDVVAAPGVATVHVSSLLAVYVGCELVVDTGLVSQELITVTAFDPTTGTITANFANAHAANAPLIGGTFPIQQPTDPFYTQPEVLSYIARAQNEFLARCPCIYQLVAQSIMFGQILQLSPCAMIEMNRVAISAANLALTSLTRASNLVTAVSATPHGLLLNEKFSVVLSTDATFLGAFKVLAVPTSLTFTYNQYAADATVAAPTIGIWKRLYEMSQEEITMQNRDWQNSFQAIPRSWFEDRTGNYAWGVSGRPTSNFPAELLISQRDSDVLLPTDGFLIPDLVLHFVKYLAMSWMYDKDGEQRNPEMAKYCKSRFDRGVMATQRWIDKIMSSAQSGSGR